MHDQKLSLHPEHWQIAFTKPAAAKYVAAGRDRVLTRWPDRPEVAQGWRLGAVILTPSTTFRDPFTESRTSDGGPILWFPAPPPPEHLRFYVLLGEPDTGNATVKNTIGEVGRMTLKSGFRVWVVADVITMTDELQQGIDDIRGRMAGMADVLSVGWAWGAVEGSPNLLDLASVLPNEA